MIPSWMYGRVDTEEVRQEADLTVFDDLPLDNFTKFVNNASISDTERTADILTKTDSHSFQIAHPEIEFSDKAIKLINGWLTMRGITNPLFPDFASACDALISAGLVNVDERVKAPTVFKSPITNVTYEDVDSLIAQERKVALGKAREVTKEEIALESLPTEQALLLLKEAERQERKNANKPQMRQTAEAWLTLHPEVANSDYNGRLLKMQLEANGITENNASVEAHEIAYKQLRATGMLTLNGAVLTKQRAAEVSQLAKQAVNTPGSVFDDTTEAEMEKLPLEELRRRADLQLTSR